MEVVQGRAPEPGEHDHLRSEAVGRPHVENFGAVAPYLDRIGTVEDLRPCAGLRRSPVSGPGRSDRTARAGSTQCAVGLSTGRAVGPGGSGVPSRPPRRFGTERNRWVQASAAAIWSPVGSTAP